MSMHQEIIVKILIEEYKAKANKDQDAFIFPAIPWKWTVYDGSKIKTYGYAHTEEDANRIGSEALRKYNR
jgi:hypothetical protein